MGVVYKLKPEIAQFILEEKRKSSILSCRALARLVEERFQTKVSKSSINILLKEAGLSMPVGRRQAKTTLKKPKEKPVFTAKEAIFKAIDSVLGGSQCFSQVIGSKLNSSKTEIALQVEKLLFAFNNASQPNTSAEALATPDSFLKQDRFLDSQKFIEQLEAIPGLLEDLKEELAKISSLVHTWRLTSSSGKVFFLDSYQYTLWAKVKPPVQFSLPLHYIQNLTQNIFQNQGILTLLMAPGYDFCPNEFFDFIFSLEADDDYLTALTLFDNQQKQISQINLEKRRYGFIFGLWPWQFPQQRQVQLVGDFKKFNFGPLNQEFYVAEANFELTANNVKNQVIGLKGCAIKEKEQNDITIYLLSNWKQNDFSLDILINTYFGHFPNFKRIFQIYSNIIENNILSLDKNFNGFSLNKENFSKISQICEAYSQFWQYFLGEILLAGIRNKDLNNATIIKEIEQLKVDLTIQDKDWILSFFLPDNYPFLTFFSKLCSYLNSLQIHFEDKRLFWVIG